MAAKLESQLREAVESKKLPAIGAIALDKSGNEIFKSSCGTVNANDPSATPFTTDTCLLIASCTKLITSVAALQLIEQGKLNLDDLVEKYDPTINQVQVLDGFDNDGKPKTHEAKQKPTILHLFTHTTGLTYDFIDQGTLQWRIAVGQPPSAYASGAPENFTSPYAHEPGLQHTYGISIDHLGFVVEKISGMRIDEYFQKHIFEPLGMKNSGISEPEGKPLLALHAKGEDGSLTALPYAAMQYTHHPPVVGAGHFLTSSLEDYAQFLLTVLNLGTHPQSGVQILAADTVQRYIFRDFLPQTSAAGAAGVAKFAASVPQMSNDAELLPGVAKGWSCGLMLNNEAVPNGRPKGSGAWAGLYNLYYWLDPTNGKLGLLGSGVIPFCDPEALYNFDALERFVYGCEPAKTRGEKGSNYAVTRAIDGSI